MNANDMNGPVNYAAIELEARRMRAEAIKSAFRAVSGWATAHLHGRRTLKAAATH